MDSNIALVLVALIGIVVPVLNWWQNRGIAKQVAIKAQAAAYKADEAVRAQNEQLHQIHVLVNSRLSDALETIEDLKALLLLALSATISPDDPRIRDVLEKADRVL